MSQSKMDRSFPQVITEEKLAEVVSIALRQDFGEGTSSIKQIGQLTHANLRAIRNWYEARNVPSSTHLLLARSSQTILRFVLEQVGGEDLWDAFRLLSTNDPALKFEQEEQPLGGFYTDKHVGINVPIKSLNKRQRWFLIRLKIKKTACADDIAEHFEVAVRTAERDIMQLKAAGRIQFFGANRTGEYRIVDG